MSSTVAGPDFICIGMQKAGTGWLFDQLDVDPNFWMPPTKELHYLDNQLKRPRTILDNMHRRGNRDLQVYNQERQARDRRPLHARDLAFLDQALKIRGQRLDFDAYAGLFHPKGELISGDITPSYSTLAAPVIRQLAARFPTLRVMLLVRDPVERSWSLLNMKVRRGAVDESQTGDWAAVQAKVTSAAFEARSYATRVWRRWSDNFSSGRIRYFFFDDIAAAPSEALNEIREFLGVAPATDRALAPDYNRKAAKAKAMMTDEVRRGLAELYADELRESALVFGGPAAGWPARYGFG